MTGQYFVGKGNYQTEVWHGRNPKARVRREEDGTWGANVWWGSNPATTHRRYFYRTRQQARNADISHSGGKVSGRVG